MKYRAKKEFELKEIAGELLLLPRGASTVDFNYVTVFNETGALILRAMEDFADEETLAKLLVNAYGIDEAQALEDTRAYLAKMLDAGLIEVE